MSPARIVLLGADIAIAAVAPCAYLHAIPAAVAALVAAWDAPCLPVPAAIAMVWLAAVPVLWRSALYEAGDCLAALVIARRHKRETCGNSVLMR